jgi:DNA invertase Pin-like site-specific DNA recombinase
MYIGYARVSTQDQNLDFQKDALKRVGCEKIIVDRVSGTVAERPGLTQLKECLRKGDTLVVWRLDRLGRSIKDLIALMSWFEQEEIGLRSLHEAIDTTSTSGKLTFHLFASLAEFERQLIQERTRAGLTAARARGRLGGRPKALQPNRQKRAVQLYHKKELTVREICEMMGISKPTLYAYVRQAQLSAQAR